MKKIAKSILVAIVLFLAIGTIEYLFLKRQRRKEEEEIEIAIEQEQEQPPAASLKLEDITPRSISEEEGNYVLDIKYPVTGIDKIDKRIKEVIDLKKSQFFSEVDSFFKEEDSSQTYPDYKFELTIVYEPFKVSDFISFKFDGYMFTGGAHGIGVLETITFDIASEEEYLLSSVFKENSAYLEELSRLSRAQLKTSDRLGNLYDEDMVNPGTAPYEKNFKHFVLRENSIVFYFEDYQVAPYAAGEQYVEFSYQELEGFLEIKV